MAARSVYYEWTCEEIDAHGDILHSEFGETLASVRRHVRPVPDGDIVSYHVGLVRNVYDDAECLQDREWAYMSDGLLPERFFDSGGCDGAKVPQRFHKEVSKSSEAL